MNAPTGWDASGRPLRLVHAATRFTPPRLRHGLAARTLLVTRVLSPEARLVVVCGPAGSGKTTLLSQAYEQWPDAVWLSVERADDDPAALWSALIDATATTIPGFGERYRGRLDVGGADAVDRTIPLVVNEIVDAARPVRFFLDDVHVLSGTRSTATLQRLLRYLPRGSALVIASRTPAPFPLGWLHMQREVVEIGPADLALDLAEAQVALTAAGVRADEDDVAALVARTEGWAAGLAWAALAAQESTDVTSVVEALDAPRGGLAAYLIEEVLDQQSPDVRDFMLDTGILTRFSSGLCDAMRGRDDSRELISALDSSNAFLVALDDAGEWFRYHHLVRDVLAARLERERPSTVPTLHRRAARWLGDRGEVAESIYHSRVAGDDAVAANTLCAHWWGMLNGGRMQSALSLFDDFGTAAICAYQPLAIAATFLYSMAGDHDSAQVFMRAAERGRHEGPPPDRSASMESSLAIMRGSVALDGVDAMYASGRRACELESEASPWRPLAVFLVALGHVWRGEIGAAAPLLADVIGQAQADQALVVDARAQLALVRLAQGDSEAAAALAESASGLAADTGLETVFVAALAHGAAAAAALAMGDLQSADAHLDAARVPMAGVNSAMPIDAMQTRLVLADAAVSLGRLSEARHYVEDAIRTSHRYRDTGVLARQLGEVAHRLADAAGSAEVELSEREKAVLDFLPSTLSVQEIADALFVSKETVRTHRRHIYRKLAVTSRDDAVVAARRSGLLPESSAARPTQIPVNSS